MIIEVYVQIGNSAEQWTTLPRLEKKERAICQRLSNRMKSTVRAIRNNKTLAEFQPHRVECSEGC